MSEMILEAYENERANFTSASLSILVTKVKQTTFWFRREMLTLAQDSRGASVPRQGQCGRWSTLHLGLQEPEQAAHIMTD